MRTSGGLTRIPLPMLEQLLSVIERRRLEAPFSEAELVDAGFRGFADDVVTAFAGVDSVGVVAALRMVIAERLDRPPPRLDLVWTGPETRASVARGTQMVVERLFESAQRSVSLASATDARARAHVFDRVRDPADTTANYGQMPRGLGDFYDDLDAGHPQGASFLSLTHVQYAVLEQWAAGAFDADWPGAEPSIPAPATITPEGLDRAAVENCVGGPFYPGIEVSWIVRAPALYAEPFRLLVSRHPDGEAQDPAAPTIGAVPLRPGFFSQQMAQPWQADFYDCHKELHQNPMGEQQFYMWWTAQRPDDVLPNVRTSDDPVRWVRGLDPAAGAENFDDAPERFARMVANWNRLGFVVRINDQLFEDEAL